MRLIDADALLTDSRMRMYYHLPNGDIAVPVIDIEHAPIIEERKTGEWTTEQVAELLANLFGDECACNFSGIDEWLPSACKYSETDCPEPKEKHGCWMQFLMQGGADMRGGNHETP